MAEAPNVFDPTFEHEGEPAGFFQRVAPVGRRAGAKRLGASVFELPPGRTSTPYHFHYANEEMLIVLAGRPSLRTPEGRRELAAGEVVAFEVGEAGAHQVSNFSDATVRYVIVSEMVAPEVCGYPDSGKVMVREQAPGMPATGRRELYRVADAVDYWEGEAPPGAPGAR